MIILSENRNETNKISDNVNSPMEAETYSRGLEDSLDAALEGGKDIVFISYSLLNETEDKIKNVLAKILEKHQKEELFTPLYSCTKELIANATKANAKKILIDEGTIQNPDNPMEVVEKIRAVLNEESLLEYGIKAKKSRLSTRTYISVRNSFLIINVINNVPLPESELNRIQERIEISSRYDSIAEFYIENPDPIAEGMGLGLSMVVVLLKSINIDYRNFDVTTDGIEKTYARIEIPLS